MHTRRKRWLAFRYLRPADLEAYFEDRARQGWMLERVGPRGLFLMTFWKRDPATYRYVVDLPIQPGVGYRPLHENAGWEYVGRMANERVWRRRYEGARPDRFDDAGTKRKQGRRLAGAVALSAWFFFVGTVAELVAWRGFDVSTTVLLRITMVFVIVEATAVAIGMVIVRIRRARRRRDAAEGPWGHGGDHPHAV
jgi:hypothetical protein